MYSFAVKVNGAADPGIASGASYIEVHERMGEPTAFRIRFHADIAEQDIPILSDPRFDPGSEIQVFAIVDQAAHCLVRGPVCGQQASLAHGGAGSYVDVVGGDASITMNRKIRSHGWIGRDSDAVRAIVGDYPGVAADIQDTPASHEEVGHTLNQFDTDLRFIQRLARRNGFVFWLDANAQGKLTAHFKRLALDGAPVAKLTLNLDPPMIKQLELAWDVERPTSAQGMQVRLSDKTDLDGAVPRSPLPALAALALADIVRDVRDTHVAPPADDAGDLRARGEGALIDAGWFITARGEAQQEAVGAILRSCTVIDLQGVGKRHSGKWLVAGVRHTLDASTHRMEFELLRNAWSRT